ncbi:tumor necrosis factor ligand superfamily member 9 [Trichosurus vulpecula]|uniref:tumor necrosis factor ligand superfamily member 9 n=1 Tax=Trichosurus vulpecula TaxID=9337 RepID=UPI00186B1EFC|nr:tumor necrosis factor ligand superfamily member 9 [Trichosurus vulpecula]
MLGPKDPPPPRQGVNWGCGVGSPPRKATLPGLENKAGSPWPGGTRPDLAMGQVSDPENPDRGSLSPVRTCRALDWALWTALLLLAGILVAAYIALRTNPAQPSASERLSAPLVSAQGPYAQLVMKDVLVQNQTLTWYSDSSYSGVLLDSQMKYDDDKGELEVGVSGLYFIYAHLKLKQVMVPAHSQGTVNVSVFRSSTHQAILTLSLDVGPSSTLTATTSQFSLTSLHSRERLKLFMSTTEGDFLDWQLVSEASTFGLFWVPGGQPLTASGAFLS